jgi:hypothetical protein
MSARNEERIYRELRAIRELVAVFVRVANRNPATGFSDREVLDAVDPIEAEANNRP